MKPTFSTIFSGGEGAGVGFRWAGYEHLWGVEFDPHIAAVAHMNGFHGVIIADVRCIDYAKLERPNHLHASPSCKRASVANTNAGETIEDIESAEAVCRALVALKPDTFTLENVYAYRHFKAYRLICSCLDSLGYWWDHHNLNSADFGVPQTRKRLWIRATQSGYLQPLPTPVAWVGWFSAIQDILDTLPPSAFAKWQLERLSPELFASCIVEGSAAGENNPFPLQAIPGDMPVFTQRARQNNPRAFLLDGKPANYAGDLKIAASVEPTPTVTASMGQHPLRAFLVDPCQSNEDRGPIIHTDEKPSMTVQSTQGAAKYRAWLEQGRTVAMTTRALARFIGFPDSFELPENRKLATTIIGNAVCPPVAKAVLETMKEALA